LKIKIKDMEVGGKDVGENMDDMSVPAYKDLCG